MKLTALRDATAPEPEKTVVSANTKPTTTKSKDARAAWIRNVNDYDRRERCEFQVARFG
jgi:hypothetical protein